MRNRTALPVLPVLAAALCSPLLAWSQGTLTPPGPPGPSMKTLAQVEPRTPISSLPFTITNPGSYYLTANLTGASGQNGLIVQADGVSVDLAGFSLTGVAGSLAGVVVPATHRNFALQNGTVANWGGTGVDAGNTRSGHFEQLRLSANGSHGLIAGFGGLVRDCVAMENTGDGIQLTSGGFAMGNNCQTNGAAGLHVLGKGNRIEANHAGLNLGAGFKVDGTQNLVIKNSASGNIAADYSIAAGNDYGQLVAGAGAGFVNSNPWANFSSAAAPTCTDGIKNGNETDVDCGGGTCAPCANGKMCAANTDCQSGLCSGGICQAPAPTCTDGIKNGTETDVDCGGGTCPPCATGKQCTVGSDCASGVCSGNVCVGLLANGASCSTSSQCSSGFCVSGVCCNSACPSGAGVCGGSCTQPGNVGTCTYPASGTVCAAPACSGGTTLIGTSTCDGTGNCVSGPTINCAPYTCSGSACLTSCTADFQCATGNYCSGGACVPKKATGLTCSASSQCSSGNCVDGYCCNSACSGTCQACSGALTGGSNGACGNVLAGMNNPNHPCSGSSVCNGSGVCQ